MSQKSDNTEFAHVTETLGKISDMLAKFADRMDKLEFYIWPAGVAPASAEFAPHKIGARAPEKSEAFGEIIEGTDRATIIDDAVSEITKLEDEKGVLALTVLEHERRIEELTAERDKFQVQAEAGEEHKARVVRSMRNLAVAIYENDFQSKKSLDRVPFEPLDDFDGLFTQIDNMTAGMSAKVENLEAEKLKLSTDLRANIAAGENRIADTNSNLTALRADLAEEKRRALYWEERFDALSLEFGNKMSEIRKLAK